MEKSLIPPRFIKQLRNESKDDKPMRTIGWLADKSYLRCIDVYQILSKTEGVSFVNYWSTRYGRVDMTLISEIKIKVDVQVHRKNRKRVISWYRIQGGIKHGN